MFIVERGLSATTDGMVVEGQRRLCEAARRVSDHHRDVTYLRSLVVPDRELCFDLFEAATPEVVKAVNDLAQVPFRRIDLVRACAGGGPGCHAGDDEPTIPPGPRPGAATPDTEEDQWTPPSTDGHDGAWCSSPSTAC